MFILNRRNPITSAIGGGIGFVKEYNADRKARKEGELDHPDDEHDDDHEWAYAIDQAQLEANPPKYDENDKEKTVEDLVADFIRRNPPPPYSEQQPTGKLTLPVVLPQRRPESRTRGFVRGYAPVLDAASVTPKAWFDFLDGFEKAITKNNLFWVANGAVWILDKAYILTQGINIWAKLIVWSIHASIEGSRRGYIHKKQNGYLDEMNESYFKPRGLYALIIKYKPDDLNELGGYMDLRQNTVEAVTRRDDPDRTDIDNILHSSAATTEHEADLPDFAPLIFPQFDNADEKEKESAWKHFQTFRSEYADRQSNAKFNALNADSRLANVAPQKEWASRYSNPEHPARQGGLIALMSGGKYNPKGPRQKIQDWEAEREGGENPRAARNEAANRIAGENKLSPNPSNDPHLTPSTTNTAERVSSNVADDGVDRNAVAWQATWKRKRGGPVQRLLRQDVLYLLVVNLPSPEEMKMARKMMGLGEEH